MNEQEVIALLKAKFGRVRMASGGYVRIPCPTCTPTDALHMKRYVHPMTLYTRCWICDKKITFEQLTGKELTRVQASRAPVEVKEHPYAKVLPYKKILKLTELPAEHPAIKFLAKDQLFNLEYYSSLGIGYIPAEGGIGLYFEESGRTLYTFDSLLFPVYFLKELVGWQLRWVPGTWQGDKMEKLRYLHLFDKGRYLYNYDNARQHEMVVVVEGVKKALKFPNGVATLGKGISSNQIQLMQMWPKITLMLDGEDDTQELARKLKLSMVGRTVVNIDLRKYGAESPDDLSVEALAQIVDKEWHEQKGG